MYLHETVSEANLTALMHFRETQTAGGLVVLTQLGHTVSLFKPGEGPSRPEGLLVARFQETSAFVPGTGSDQLYCSDLDDFVRQGIRKWDSLVPRLGQVAKIEVHLEEIAETVPETGILVVSEQLASNTGEFKGYVANPDEIAAIEKIAHSVALPISDAGLGTSSSLYM